MLNSRQPLFAPGATVTILTVTGSTYTGQIISEIGERGHDADPGFAAEFIVIQLTSTQSPFTSGEIVAFNLLTVIAIGPVS
ncbi:MAG: hypothetical protein H6Q75_1677 [Firmicutes bacterium]|nr:hypothetical protein [Bacillota bacterium]